MHTAEQHQATSRKRDCSLAGREQKGNRELTVRWRWAHLQLQKGDGARMKGLQQLPAASAVPCRGAGRCLCNWTAPGEMHRSLVEWGTEDRRGSRGGGGAGRERGRWPPLERTEPGSRGRSRRENGDTRFWRLELGVPGWIRPPLSPARYFSLRRVSLATLTGRIGSPISILKPKSCPGREMPWSTD